MKVALVIINYNTRGELKAALDSIRPLPEAEELEVIVVDNGSTDGSQEMVEDRVPGGAPHRQTPSTAATPRPATWASWAATPPT